MEHRFFEPISWEKQIGANYRQVKFGSNYRKPRVQERGRATNYKSIGLILTFRQLTIKIIILGKAIQVCFLLFYCNTEPLQGFLRRFAEVQTIASWWKVSRALIAKKSSRKCDQSFCCFLLNVLPFDFLVSVVVFAVA